jgi:hypothetical protein
MIRIAISVKAFERLRERSALASVGYEAGPTRRARA